MIQRTLLLIACLSFVVGLCPVQSQQCEAGKREQSFRLAVDEFLSKVEADQPETLGERFSARGVVFGIDADPTPLKQAKRELKPGGALNRLFVELAAVLSESTGRKIVTSVSRAERSWVGTLNLSLHGSTKVEQSLLNSLVMDFVFERGQWKLMSIEYP
jgi:hypothetical protein